jgi:prepilin-type N-terminal cleavage/methylation domain-containing protein
MTASASRRARGFTLLEVLAAVAVLAIVYTSLARAAMQGLANQGDASRRLRASLLADQALGELEAQLSIGSVPPVGESELASADEDFAIALEVRPFDTLAGALAAAALPEAEERDREARDGDGESSPLELLAAQPGGAPPLLEIALRVRWLEGASEQEVTRTTFAADPALVESALAVLGESGSGARDGDDAGDQTGEETGAGLPEPSGQDRGGLPFPSAPVDEEGAP